MLKILFADRTGLCVLFKRLDRGKFPLPTVIAPGATRVEISVGELRILLEGIVLPRRGVKQEPNRARKKRRRLCINYIDNIDSRSPWELLDVVGRRRREARRRACQPP
jgi:hypothetical protein